MKLLEIKSPVVYHGTARKGTEFKKLGEHHRAGIYFSTRYSDAKYYAEADAESLHDAEPKVIHARLRIKNPKEITGIDSQELTVELIRNLQKEGYDGIRSGVEWVAFDPDQIEVLKVELL
jgi:hypothetical protein